MAFRERLAVTSFNTPNDNFWGYGTAAPTVGAYKVGDVVFNTVPTASGVFCWVCTTAGTPGTWKTVVTSA